MITKRGLAAAMLVVLLSCAPPQAVDRVIVDAPPANPTGGTGGSGGSSNGGNGDTGGSGGGSVMGGAGGGGVGGTTADARDANLAVERPGPDLSPDRTPDRAPDLTPDLPPPPDRAPDLSPDTAPDAALPRVAQLVVGSTTTLLPGDATIRTIMATRLAGVSIRLRDDNGAVDLVNTILIVIAGSVESTTVANRYRNVAVPVISLEYSLFDDMGMTGTVDGTDFGEDGGNSQINILDGAHPLAAGLTGVVTVVNAAANMGWGSPPPTANRVASIEGLASRIAIFAYPRGAMMPGGPAPAKRIGFFALETSAAQLSDNGIKLLGAALDWAILPD
jgi:hypothetical protein